MTDRAPLVLDTGDVRELRQDEDLKLPLEERFKTLQARFELLLTILVDLGLPLPGELLSGERPEGF